EIECPLSNQIIALLHPLLRRLDGLIEPSMLKLLTFFKTKALHDLRHPISRAKIAHQIVFETDIEPRRSRVALPRATAAQLSIDSARLVAFSANYLQAAELCYARAKLNIGAAAGHVR